MKLSARWSLLALVVSGACLDVPARAEESVQDLVDGWMVRAAPVASVPAGTPLPDLLYRGVADGELGRRLVEAAGPQARALSDSLLSFLRLTEPVARRHLPELYVISDFGPPVDERPPAWAQVRDLGVKVFRRIAFDPAVARDLRALRRLDELRPAGRDPKPGEVGGLIAVLEEWWIDRGDDPALTHDLRRIPTPDAWLRRLEDDPPDTEWQGLALLADLDGGGLKTRLFLDALDADHHAFLAAECVRAQGVDGLAMVEAGIEAEAWDPQQGRMVGHRIERLRDLARRILARITDHIASGADEGSLRNDWVLWWKTARFQARYWRDPLDCPTLDPYLGGTDRPVAEGGVEAAPWVREFCVAVGFQEFLLDRLGPAQSPMVAELMSLLALPDREAAAAAGFNLAYRRRPLLSRRNYDGDWVAILWPRAQSVMRRMLARITREELPVYAVDSPELENAFWRDWWEAERYDPRWYRNPSAIPERPASLRMPRARAQ